MNPFKSSFNLPNGESIPKIDPKEIDTSVFPDSSVDGHKDLFKYATINQGMLPDREQIRRMHEQNEGLNMSPRRTLELCDMWRFYVFSDPIQRGIDVGLVTGGFTAVGSCYWQHNRVPYRFVSFFMVGFAAAMLVFPTMIMLHNISNENKRSLREKTMMLRNREQFLKGGGNPGSPV